MGHGPSTLSQDSPPSLAVASTSTDMPSLSPVPERTHPLQIAARTYALSLSLSLAPSLVPLVTSAKARRGGLKTFAGILRRELGWNGFAFAMTLGVGGGSALQHLWAWLEKTYGESQGPTFGDANTTFAHTQLRRVLAYTASLPVLGKAFVANAMSATLAILMLQSRRRGRPDHRVASLPLTVPMQDSLIQDGRRASPTLDLSLLLFVRAMDALVRATILPMLASVHAPGREDEIERVGVKKRRLWTSRIDAFVFWASSARIMWCFFYEPARLPRSYNKWIMSLANIDPRILGALRAIRNGNISYIKGRSYPADLISSLATDLGYPAAWGDIGRIPAYGAANSAAAWKVLGVTSRDGLGGIPCELVHGSVTGGSCTANASIRGLYAFAEALAIYLPVHTLPILLTNPAKLFRVNEAFTTALSVLRSSAFLSTFVSSIWMSVCLTRTLLLPRLFPGISHDFWDGPLGCTYAGSLVCGASIWIEQGRRRGEMTLYVLPRALRACLSEKWIRSGSKSVKIIERLVFVLSLAALLTASTHRTDSLRGMSRWTLAFIMKGPKIAQRKLQKSPDTTVGLKPCHSKDTSQP